MDKNFYWYAGAIVFFVALVTGLVLNSAVERKKQETCQQARIRPFSEKFFTWGGIVELNKVGGYQPKCL